MPFKVLRLGLRVFVFRVFRVLGLRVRGQGFGLGFGVLGLRAWA